MGKNSDTRLKKVINLEFITLTLVAIAVTMVLSTFIFYEVYKAEIIRDLKGYAEVLKNTGDFDGDDTSVYASVDTDDLRLTLVAPDGSVIYDNQADETSMQNHFDRPEIAEAFEKGDGQVIRKSATLNKSTYYYAILLKSGRVLRIARESNNVISMFLAAMPVMLLVMALLVVVTIIVTHYLTRNILKPIEQMANRLDDDTHIVAYREMRPFIDMIQKQHADIVKSSQMRQEFTANVSHELKTPITSMKVLSESLLTQSDVPAEMYREFMEDIVQEIDREAEIISDLLTLVKTDKGPDSLNKESVDMDEFMDLILKRLRPLADKRSIQLSYESFGEIHASIDKVKFTLAISNLIENGIKYNVDGGWIKVSLNSDHKNFYIKVADSGVGIPEDCINHIFERFYRVDKARSRDTGGTGLGLAITKNIIILHKGTINVYSEPGKGTTFTVRVPLGEQ